MKKSIFALAILAASTFGFQAFAQNSAPAPGAQSTEQTAKTRKAPKADLFEGITLSVEQQTKLDALREQNRKERAERKAERTAKADGAKKGQQGVRSEARKRQMAAIKEILTPEQYTKYLENSLTAQRGQKSKGMKAQRHGKRRAAAEKSAPAQS